MKKTNAAVLWPLAIGGAVSTVCSAVCLYYILRLNKTANAIDILYTIDMLGFWAQRSLLIGVVVQIIADIVKGMGSRSPDHKL